MSHGRSVPENHLKILNVLHLTSGGQTKLLFVGCCSAFFFALLEKMKCARTCAFLCVCAVGHGLGDSGRLAGGRAGGVLPREDSAENSSPDRARRAGLLHLF